MLKNGLNKLKAVIAAAFAGAGAPAHTTSNRQAMSQAGAVRPVVNHPPKLVRVQLFPEPVRVAPETLVVSRPKNGTGRNQRKKRKAARRAWAAGNKKAFN
jgi:hypothetical protein